MPRNKFTTWQNNMVTVTDSEIAESMHIAAILLDVPAQWIFEAVLRVSRDEILNILDDIAGDASLLDGDE